jgi:2-hydroxy-6-oxonona-2,4-dienedioate hydrolase
MDAIASGALSEVDAWDARARRFSTPCGEGHMIWRCWGAGRPVALLHGGAGSWRHWIRNIPVLASRFRVLAPDLPGLGESASLPEPWSPGASAAIVAEGLGQILDSREQVDLVGFSAGSLVAGAVAEQLGQQCRMLVLVGASGLGVRRAPVALEKIRGKTGERRRIAHHHNLAQLMIADPRHIDEQAIAIQEWNTVHARVNSVGFAESGVLRDSLPNLRGRLGAVWGAEDAVARGSLTERLAALRALRPDVEIHIIPSAGHWVAYEAATAFNAILVAMLDGDANSSEGDAHGS